MNLGDRVKYVELGGTFDYGIEGTIIGVPRLDISSNTNINVDWGRVVNFAGETAPSVRTWWCAPYEIEVVEACAHTDTPEEAPDADYAIPMETTLARSARHINQVMQRAVLETSASLRSGNANVPTRTVRPSGVTIDEYFNDPYPGIRPEITAAPNVPYPLLHSTEMEAQEESPVEGSDFG